MEKNVILNVKKTPAGSSSLFFAGLEIGIDPHRAEIRTAHRAEFRVFRALTCGAGTETSGAFRVEGKIELFFPIEVASCVRNGVVDLSCSRQISCHIYRVGSDFEGDDGYDDEY